LLHRTVVHVVVEVGGDKDVVGERAGSDVGVELRVVDHVIGAALGHVDAGAIPAVDVIEIDERVVLRRVAAL
jgi:hypothetical protein